MSTVPASEMTRLRALNAPSYDDVVKMANRWMVQRGASAADFARLLGKARSTMNIFLSGRWLNHDGIVSPELLTAVVWEYITENPARAPRRPSDRLLDTQGVKLIRKRFNSALRGAAVLLYGAPATEKSFVLQHLVAEREEGSNDDAVYIYCGAPTGPLTMLRMVARELGLGLRSNNCQSLTERVFSRNWRRGKGALRLWPTKRSTPVSMDWKRCEDYMTRAATSCEEFQAAES